MSKSSLTFLIIVSVLIAEPAKAQYVPPAITATIAIRGVNTVSNAEGDPAITQDADESTKLGNGSFDATVGSSTFGEEGSQASGSASQDSTIAALRIEGQGRVEGSASTVVQEGDSSNASISLVSVHFSVPVDATFSLAGAIRAAGSGAVGGGFGGIGEVQIRLQGAAPDGTPFDLARAVSSVLAPADPVEFFFVQEVRAATAVVLSVTAQATAANMAPGSHSASAEYRFQIDVGDEDGDGLLDTWESAGIDVNDDGTPEIDLPAMGADPMHKDSFVELDAMTSAPVDLAAIGMVEDAFDNAPADKVRNPDGQGGVNLHVDIDETNVPSQSLSGGSWPPAFDMIKSQHFGTPSDRARPNWDLVQIARRRVYRYCLWADTLSLGGTSASGVAERPGNDLIVARAVAIASSPNRPTDALAGTLMHELGHTFGLAHGGQDLQNYKPNYLSIMNHAYQVPFDIPRDPETNPAEAWYLDYSTKANHELEEHALLESEGLDGPTGRLILFNSAPVGATSILTIADADASMIDWNGDRAISTGGIPQDISRLEPIASPDETLVSYTDWDRLRYSLGGGVNFDDGVARDLSAIPIELDPDTTAFIRSLEVVDLSVPEPDVAATGLLAIASLAARLRVRQRA